MILTCKDEKGNDVPVHVNITQEYIRDLEKDQFFRYFEFDHVNNTDRCMTSQLSTACYYTDGSTLGQIYMSVDNSTISIELDRYLRNTSLDYTTTSASAVIDCSQYKGILNDDVKIDCHADGTFSIAYLTSKDGYEIGQHKTTCQYVVNEYEGNDDYNNHITDLCSFVVIKDFAVIGTEIIEQTSRIYSPYVDMGVIPLFRTKAVENPDYDEHADKDSPNSKETIDQKNRLDNSTLKEYLDEEKALTFQLFGDPNDVSSGIDFKYIYPIRRFEYLSTELDRYIYIQDFYNREAPRDLSCYSYNVLHYIEEKYNKYIHESDDAIYYDLTELERFTYLSTIYNENNIYNDYQLLAHHRAHEYLSVLRDEVKRYPIQDISSEYFNQTFSVIEPYVLVDFNSLPEDAQGTYLSGTLLSTINRYNVISSEFQNNRPYEIVLDSTDQENNTISVSWMRNDQGDIKLDFNTMKYLQNSDNVRSINLKTATETVSVKNYRNRLHLFLNLDRPGDSGYLNLTSWSNSESVFYTLYIKNISTKDTPKFVMKRVRLELTHDFIESIDSYKTQQNTDMLMLDGVKYY